MRDMGLFGNKVLFEKHLVKVALATSSKGNQQKWYDSTQMNL